MAILSNKNVTPPKFTVSRPSPPPALLSVALLLFRRWRADDETQLCSPGPAMISSTDKSLRKTTLCGMRSCQKVLCARGDDTPLTKPVNRSVERLNRRAGGPTVRVMQWNMLADGLAENGDFARCPASALEWGNRAPLVLSEIERAEADIVCMQEVNRLEWIEPFLRERGYKCIFKEKEFSPCTHYGKPADGVALFYWESKFSLTGDPSLSCFLNEDGQREAQVWHFIRLLHGAWTASLTPWTQKQVKIMAQLEEKEQRRRLNVVTTHLKAKAGNASDVRHRQARQLAECLPCDEAVVVCGDFNAPPWEGAVATMRVNCGLESAYDSAEGFTTFKIRQGEGEHKEMVDYLFFSPGYLTPLERWRLLTEQEVGRDGLPSPHYPSDHVALLCEFEMRSGQG